MVENNSRCGDSNWRAAGNSVKKKRNLDETGLEILGCRHTIAQAAVNMFYGEVYGYAHYLQKSFLYPRKFNFCGMMSFASIGHGYGRRIPLVYKA